MSVLVVTRRHFDVRGYDGGVRWPFNCLFSVSCHYHTERFVEFGAEGGENNRTGWLYGTLYLRTAVGWCCRVSRMIRSRSFLWPDSRMAIFIPSSISSLPGRLIGINASCVSLDSTNFRSITVLLYLRVWFAWAENGKVCVFVWSRSFFAVESGNRVTYLIVGLLRSDAYVYLWD